MSYNKASVSITDKTKIDKLVGKERKPANFADLKVGMKVQAKFTGPAPSCPCKPRCGDPHSRCGRQQGKVVSFGEANALCRLWLLVVSMLIAAPLRAGDSPSEPIVVLGLKETAVEGALTSLEARDQAHRKIAERPALRLQLDSERFFASDTSGRCTRQNVETFAGFTMIESAADGVFRVIVHCSSGSCGIYTLGLQSVAPPVSACEVRQSLN